MTIHAVPKIARALVVLVAALAFAASGAAAELVEGKTYRRIANPQPTETGKKIEVIEFFSYGCPHCAELEPHLDAWLAKAPQDVAFRRVPVMFQQRWVPLAKIYYTLDAPPPDLEIQFDVEIYFPKGQTYRPLEDVSPVVKSLARTQFDDYVKRVRIFAHPRIARRVAELAHFDKLLAAAVEA